MGPKDNDGLFQCTDTIYKSFKCDLEIKNVDPFQDERLKVLKFIVAFFIFSSPRLGLYKKMYCFLFFYIFLHTNNITKKPK
jgi:hypothetical protein